MVDSHSLTAPLLNARDRRTLELRQFFGLPDSERPNRGYQLDVYFFFPRSFGVGPGTWGRELFYRYTQVYLRLHASRLSLAQLQALNDPHNPLALLHRRLAALLDVDAPNARTLTTLAQMYGTELTDTLYQELAALRHLREAKGEATAELLHARLASLCEAATGALDALRYVRRQAWPLQRVAPAGLLASMDFVEEYACAALDESLSEFALGLQRAQHLYDGSGSVARMHQVITSTLSRLSYHRRRQGFVLAHTHDPEYYAYRLGQLKKELQRSLYVDLRRSSRDPFITNSAAMVAAGLAATWATLAQIPLLTGQWGTRQGLLLLGLAVGAYILKDRMKEWVRLRLSRRWLPWDLDNEIQGDVFVDAGIAGFAGRERQRARWLTERQLPPPVRDLRSARGTVVGHAWELEHVLHFHQRLELEAQGDAQPGVGYGLQEILRFSLDDVLHRFDDPKEPVSYFDVSEARFITAKFPKVYHLNVIHSVVDTHTGVRCLGRTRVVLNRKGIVRLEPVTQPL